MIFYSSLEKSVNFPMPLPYNHALLKYEKQANRGKFLTKFIRSTLDHNSITFLVQYKRIKSANEVKLLRNSIERKEF